MVLMQSIACCEDLLRPSNHSELILFDWYIPLTSPLIQKHIHLRYLHKYYNLFSSIFTRSLLDNFSYLVSKIFRQALLKTPRNVNMFSHKKSKSKYTNESRNTNELLFCSLFFQFRQSLFDKLADRKVQLPFQSSRASNLKIKSIIKINEEIK